MTRIFLVFYRMSGEEVDKIRSPESEDCHEVPAQTVGTTEELEKLRSRRRYRKKVTGAGGVVNVWDVPEFMPGAKPGANPKDREEFQRRSIAVFIEQNMANREQQIELQLVEEQRLSSRMEEDLTELTVMFPLVDALLIQETYLSHKGDRSVCIEELLAISSELEAPLPKLTKSFDMSDFPPLTSKHDKLVDKDSGNTKASYSSVVIKGSH